MDSIRFLKPKNKQNKKEIIMADKDLKKEITPFEENSTLKNFDNPKNESIEQIVAREVAKAESRMKAKVLKGQTNSIQLGVTIKDLETREGAEIKDRTTGEVQTDNNGEIKRYPNKYYVTVTFKGGSLKQEIKGNLFAMLELNKDYFATGFIGEVSNFGKTEIAPIFTDFEDLSA